MTLMMILIRADGNKNAFLNHIMHPPYFLKIKHLKAICCGEEELEYQYGLKQKDASILYN
jgi:hypothetical protein